MAHLKKQCLFNVIVGPLYQVNSIVNLALVISESDKLKVLFFRLVSRSLLTL